MLLNEALHELLQAVSPLLDYFLYGRLSMTDEDLVALREGAILVLAN